MCGVAGIPNIKTQTKELRNKVPRMAQRVRHRGPDWSGTYVGGSAILAHERLSIVDPQSGGQPLYSPDRKQMLAVNGETYNHRDICACYAGQHDLQTGNDCEMTLVLYKDKGIHFPGETSGTFTFILYNEERDEFLTAHDPIGVISLYIGRNKGGKIYFGSELKAPEGLCDGHELFLPGHHFYNKEDKIRRRYTREWTDYEPVKDNIAKISDAKEALEDAVHRQLMSDVPYGILLSGGLDSSVISAIARKYIAKRIETDGVSGAWWPQLHSLAIGLKRAPDLIKAHEVAGYIGVVHHEINYTIQRGPDAIQDAIYFVETYDVAMVCASAPMYLLVRVIRSVRIKMVLNGEGANEVFGGYLYFHKAPTPKDFRKEAVRRLSKLHMYDCLHAGKSLSARGIEGRVPPLDKEFLDVAMALNPKAEMYPGEEIGERIIREAFAGMLPKSVVWRQEEQFSGGTGYSWIDTSGEITAVTVSDGQMEHAVERFPINTPLNKKEYYYRSIFEEHFPSESAACNVPSIPNVACSMAKVLAWDVASRNLNEPGDRAVRGVHEEVYVEEIR